MDQPRIETESKAIFSRVEMVVPPPFLAGRTLARALESKRTSKEVLVWRWVASLSFFALVGWITFTQFQPSKSNEALFAYQPYVIHVDLNENDLKFAQSAEVELPEGVNFVSKDEVVKSMRKLKLPISASQAGRSRLPFVVLADRTGKLPLQVHIYDSDDRLIETKTLTLTFAEGKKG